MNTLITGAFGRVGTALIDHTNGTHDYRFLDHRKHPSLKTIVGDVSSYKDIVDAFVERDAVVHLAGASQVNADWQSVLENNIIGGYNCLEAARRNEIDRVVLASTNHVVGMYEEEYAPDLYQPECEFMIDHQSPIRPDSYYATSKIFNEALGRYYVETYQYPRRVYVLRIGSVRYPPYDHPYGDAERGVKNDEWDRESDEYERAVNRMKALWQSRRDAASLIECCLDDKTVEFEIFFGVSDNYRSWLDIDHARNVLDYNPEDSAEAWTSPPEGGTRTVSETTAIGI